jgi:hypothetical protein
MVMDIKTLLQKARSIWGNDKLSLDQILVRQGVSIGDLHRLARDHDEGQTLNEVELKKELGNVIFSMIRWCDDLGYSPEECIELAIQAQTQYRQERF